MKSADVDDSLKLTVWLKSVKPYVITWSKAVKTTPSRSMKLKSCGVIIFVDEDAEQRDISRRLKIYDWIVNQDIYINLTL